MTGLWIFCLLLSIWCVCLTMASLLLAQLVCSQAHDLAIYTRQLNRARPDNGPLFFPYPEE